MLSPRMLGWPRLGLCLIALRMRALLLRMVGAGPFLPPVLVALLLAAGTAAIAWSVGLRCLRLPLAVTALLHSPILAFAARTLALKAFVTSAARAGLGDRCRRRGLGHRGFRGGLAPE